MGWEFDIQVRSLPEDDKSNTLTWVGAPILDFSCVKVFRRLLINKGQGWPSAGKVVDMITSLTPLISVGAPILAS